MTLKHWNEVWHWSYKSFYKHKTVLHCGGKTRRANAQTIHTHRTSSQSSSLHNQPSWKFELLPTTLWQNDCISSSCLVTLWPWENIKVIQNGIKLQSLVVFSTIQSVLTHDNVNITFHKNHISGVLSLEYYLHKTDLAWASTNQQVVTTYWISSKLILQLVRKLWP